MFERKFGVIVDVEVEVISLLVCVLWIVSRDVIVVMERKARGSVS